MYLNELRSRSIFVIVAGNTDHKLVKNNLAIFDVRGTLMLIFPLVCGCYSECCSRYDLLNLIYEG